MMPPMVGPKRLAARLTSATSTGVRVSLRIRRSDTGRTVEVG